MLAMIFFVFSFCLTTGSLQQENRKLQNENSALLRLLREMTTDAEKEVGYGPSSFNAERAVGEWTSIHGGDCTPDELADATCRTIMKPLGVSMFPTCECLASLESGVGNYVPYALVGNFPPRCSQIDYSQQRAFDGGIGHFESCKPGEVLVGPSVCCPLSAWEGWTGTAGEFIYPGTASENIFPGTASENIYLLH